MSKDVVFKLMNLFYDSNTLTAGPVFQGHEYIEGGHEIGSMFIPLSIFSKI